MAQDLVVKPIGVFKSEMKNPYDLPRQPDGSLTVSCIELDPGQNFEQALDSLNQFDRIWVLYHFHHNSNWKPMTLPPRGTTGKVGVFSTRSPYRPNPIGLSCLRLLKIDGLKLWVEGADLMDQTPIIDIKPYLALHDSFPEASMGWLEGVDSLRWTILINTEAQSRLEWLSSKGEEKIKTFMLRQLEYDPTNSEKKRVHENEFHWTLAYRTWRIDFRISAEESKTLEVFNVRSAYSTEDLTRSEDIYQDHELHREFLKKF